MGKRNMGQCATADKATSDERLSDTSTKTSEASGHLLEVKIPLLLVDPQLLVVVPVLLERVLLLSREGQQQARGCLCRH